MKRTFRRLCSLLALTLVLVSTTAAPPASAEAVVLTDNQTVPIEFVATSCTGETVVINGESHVLFQAVGTPGGRFENHTHIQFHLQGTSASGTLYTANETVNGHFTGEGDGPQGTFTSVGNLTLVSQGSGDNLLLRTRIHTTVNDNGEITAVVFEFEVVCQG